MLKNPPYSTLKQDERAYEILLLRDQHDNTFTDIAKEYGITVARVSQIYSRIKVKQIRLYIHHIAAVLGHEDTSQVKKVYDKASECYQDRTFACAYLEKKYKAILDEYRAGEPGMPSQFVRGMPPFRPKLSQKTIARVIEMREVQKASYETISNELFLTRAKAKHTYEWFYHEQVLEILKTKEKEMTSHEEARALRDFCFKGNKTSKKRFDTLMDR